MYPTSHAATAAGAGVASAVVFDNDDLVHLVLQHAALDPVSLVAVSRVNHAFRRVCQRDTGLLLAAAAGREYITTRALTGLMGVDAAEADALFTCIYPPSLDEHSRSSEAWRDGAGAWEVIGGMKGRCRRWVEHARCRSICVTRRGDTTAACQVPNAWPGTTRVSSLPARRGPRVGGYGGSSSRRHNTNAHVWHSDPYRMRRTSSGDGARRGARVDGDL